MGCGRRPHPGIKTQSVLRQIVSDSRAFIAELVALLGEEGVLGSPVDLRAYGYDASLEWGVPEVIALPASTAQVAAAIRLAHRWGIPFLPRGSGTNLSGGTVPVRGGMILELSRMNRILEIDLFNRRAVVEPGLLNLDLQEALAPLGYRFAPDPSSQRISTLGGNAGENSGGPHCLRYGVTSQHILGLEAVLPDGEVITLGGKALDPPGYDLVGLLVGSEGTLAVITRLVLRLLPLPEATETLLAIFRTVEEASQAVSEIIARGILPACLEMMDSLVLQAVEASLKAGYPLDAGAVLLVELEGTASAVAEESEDVSRVLAQQGAREVRRAREAAERERLWSGRRGAFSAVARLRPNFLVADGTVPRTRLPEILKRVAEIGRCYGLSIGNVFHAGDGNLHPLFLFDSRDAEERERAEVASREILQACVEVGGTLSGEHGIGLEKVGSMGLVFSAGELEAMRRVKEVFDPGGLLNPGKVLPPPQDERNAPGSTLAGDPGERGPLPHSVTPMDAGWDPGILTTADCDRYAVAGRSPRMVAFPRNADEVAGILALARQEKMGVVPCGGGTALGWGATPERLDLVLSLSRLDRVVEYDPADLTITAEAGLSLERLQALLAGQGQMLPLDPPCPARATLGGTVAANLSGPGRLLYGPPRDLLLGVRVVLADGTVGRFGGRTVKNVSGYDLCRLFAGSRGTLGVIVETTFRLYPRPEARRGWLAAFDRLPQALLALGEILGSGIELSSLELLNPLGVQRMISLDSSVCGISGGLRAGRYLLGGQVAGRTRETEERIARLERLCRAHGASWQEVSPGMAGDPWNPIRDFPLARPEEAICRIHLPVSSLGGLMQEAERVPLLSHAGCGLAFLALPSRGGHRMEETPRWASWALSQGGTFTVLSAPSEIQPGLPSLVLSPPGLDLMRRLRARFDPHGILSPGSFP
ncbi:MAG: FAD-binding protein [Candidatus Tectomicrobia bacterium]|uniref:FAD-binding protein n=1 Tax=Tectimicrobiota bacterium TaxID=2528274 RepID=A0A932FX25_UNCTE|nr:FAD-binding protein [Candidatus Tectomicrobia bacterium]